MAKKIILPVVLLLMVAVAFLMIRGVTPWQDESALSGDWTLDEDTRFWMQRTCLDVVFSDTVSPGLAIEIEDEQARIRFNDSRHTTLTGTYSGRTLSARQFVATSQVGRFCGAQTTLDITWRIRHTGQEELVGSWMTPACDICPDRRFRAVRKKTGTGADGLQE